MKKQKVITVKEIELLKTHITKTSNKPLFIPHNHLFEAQRAFFEDTSQYVVACCSRRAGKSHAIAVKLINEALKNPKGLCVYITLSKTSARLIIFDTLCDILEESSIEAKINHQEQIITFPNKSKIAIYGAKDMSEIEKLRGVKFRLCCIDEAQSFKHSILFELVTNILPPALGDYQAQLLVTGTPSRRKAGIFYDMCHKLKTFAGYSPHHWTLEDNTRFPAFVLGLTTYEAYIEDVLKTRNISKDDPAFIREYKGKFIDDTSTLVLNIPLHARIEELPCLGNRASESKYTYYLAIDTGYIDKWGFSIWATHPDDRTGYLIKSYEQENKDFSVSLERIKIMNEFYHFNKICIDATEFGNQFASEILRRYGVRIEMADKKSKGLYLELMSSDCNSGNVKVITPECEELLFQCDNICWEYNPQTGERKINPFIDSVKRDHSMDSALYGYRLCRHYKSNTISAENANLSDFEIRIQQHKEKLEKMFEEQKYRNHLDGKKSRLGKF